MKTLFSTLNAPPARGAPGPFVLVLVLEHIFSTRAPRACLQSTLRAERRQRKLSQATHVPVLSISRRHNQRAASWIAAALRRFSAHHTQTSHLWPCPVKGIFPTSQHLPAAELQRNDRKLARHGMSGIATHVPRPEGTVDSTRRLSPAIHQSIYPNIHQSALSRSKWFWTKYKAKNKVQPMGKVPYCAV